MADAERAALAALLAGTAGLGRRWAIAGVQFVATWAICLLGYLLLWSLLAWLARLAFGADVGWRSAAAPAIVAFGVLVCGLYAGVSAWRWARRGTDPRAAMRQDLANGEVAEEHFGFDAAKRFQEPEHGGLMYFLRTEAGKVFVLYDHESQTLGAQGEDPFKSPFAPRTRLTLVRAPVSKLVLATLFEGEPLAAGAALPMNADPERWPDDEAFCKVAWDQLERRFGGR